MESLKRLSGAKSVAQDDFSAGIGTYIVTFDQPPTSVTMAAIKKEVGKFKLEKVQVKMTGKVVEKNKGYAVATYTLADAAGDTDDILAKVAELVKAKKSMLILTGNLVEDDKGKQTLELTKVSEIEKKK